MRLSSTEGILFGYLLNAAADNQNFLESAEFKIFEQLKELIHKDTLKTMQLLGFNYKAAIGEPLTEVCANAITKFTNKGGQTQKKQIMKL